MHGDYFDNSPLIPPQPEYVLAPRRQRRLKTLLDDFQTLRDAGGDGWDKVEDPHEFLLKERGEPCQAT